MLNNILDISHYQAPDFEAIENDGVIGIISKATQGRSLQDVRYQHNKEVWKGKNLLFGSYHFNKGANNDDEVKQQVNFFLTTIGDFTNEILVLDYEDGGNGILTIPQAELFLYMVKEQTKRPVVFYASDIVFQGLENDFILNECGIWVARYGREPKYCKKWDIWQYTEKGTEPNDNDTFDKDYFNSDDIQDLYKFWNVEYPAVAENGTDKQTDTEAKEGT
jgi:lysozyme